MIKTLTQIKLPLTTCHPLWKWPFPGTFYQVRFRRDVERRNPIRVLTDDGRDFATHQLGIPEPAEASPAPIKRQQQPQFDKSKKQAKKVGVNTKLPRDEFEFLRLVAQSKVCSMKALKKPLILLEGERLILDAFDAGVCVRKIFLMRGKEMTSNLQHMALTNNIPVAAISRQDIKIATGVVTSPGIFAMCTNPDLEQTVGTTASGLKIPVTLVADNFRDPGNMGGLIRCAAAAGAQRIICTGGCVSIWNPKVMRAATGTLFRIPISHTSPDKPLREWLSPAKRIFYAQMMEGEGDGRPYCSADYFSNPHDDLVLVVGGEASGFNPDTKQLLEEFKAEKLWVDMSNGVESLNNYVTAAVILFEMRRTFVNKSV